MFALILLWAQASAPAEIVIREPATPSRIETVLTAECENREISVHYVVETPGPDLFSRISVGDEPLDAREIGTLNDMIGGYFLEHVSVPACDTVAGEYEAHLRIAFGGGEERYQYLLAIRNGRIRKIR